jgi:U3 small nucleolar RNA-associated protein MPP10
MKARKARKKRQDALAGAVGKFGSRGRKVPKNVKEAKDVALKSLVKTGKGVTVVGKERRRPLGSREAVGRSRSDTKGSGEGKNWKL